MAGEEWLEGEGGDPKEAKQTKETTQKKEEEEEEEEKKKQTSEWVLRSLHKTAEETLS